MCYTIDSSTAVAPFVCIQMQEIAMIVMKV